MHRIRPTMCEVQASQSSLQVPLRTLVTKPALPPQTPLLRIKSSLCELMTGDLQRSDLGSSKHQKPTSTRLAPAMRMSSSKTACIITILVITIWTVVASLARVSLCLLLIPPSEFSRTP